LKRPWPWKAGIAWCLTCFDGAEERLEGAVYPLDYVLHELAVNFAIFGQLGFDAWKSSLLLVVGD
jgi:hypothetical protein